MDEAALTSRIAEIESSPAVRPDVFLLYYDCLAAARSGNLEVLTHSLEVLAGAPVAAPAFRLRKYADETFTAGETDRYSRSVNADPASKLVLERPETAIFDRASRLLERAFELLDRGAPEVSAEIRALVKEIVLVCDGSEAAMSLDGATSFYAWGSLFLNADKHKTAVAMAEAIAHEGAHSHLYGLALGEPLVDNPNEERYRSPLRIDPRPMDGITHATFVSARMYYALDRLLASSLLNPEEQAVAQECRGAARKAFFEGHATFAAHARPTTLGRALLADAYRYMEKAAA
ncbi:MAG TPA: HEXXH motif-containing putative peptide modification protein [Xanthobacteraceae bacterium]|jgi:HEXXH motif-containing protein